MILKNILQINQILSKIQTTSNFQLDWKIAEYIHSSKQHMDFYNSKINQLFEKYGERDDEGNIIHVDNGVKIKPDEVSTVMKKINELNLIEIKFDFSLTYEEISQCNLDIKDLVFLKEYVF